MPKAIITKFHPATLYKGDRVSATDEDGNRVISDIDPAWSDPHRTVAEGLCEKMGWSGKLLCVKLNDAKVFVFMDAAEKLAWATNNLISCARRHRWKVYEDERDAIGEASLALEAYRQEVP
jgi:hypothetical protein